MHGVPLDRQAAHMRDPRAADDATRDDLFHRLDNRGSLSRADMALATDLPADDVGRIIRARWERDAELRRKRAQDRSAPHAED